jgi:hypothetical protein
MLGILSTITYLVDGCELLHCNSWSFFQFADFLRAAAITSNYDSQKDISNSK